ncbi:MAG: hypothetical protein QF786_15745, partial [Vicinamibacterales bacterium]|nr:hypothetical protein [Vicinamibacterales bacterium]
ARVVRATAVAAAEATRRALLGVLTAAAARAAAGAAAGMMVAMVVATAAVVRMAVAMAAVVGVAAATAAAMTVVGVAPCPATMVTAAVAAAARGEIGKTMLLCAPSVRDRVCLTRRRRDVHGQAHAESLPARRQQGAGLEGNRPRLLRLLQMPWLGRRFGSDAVDAH